MVPTTVPRKPALSRASLRKELELIIFDLDGTLYKFNKSDSFAGTGLYKEIEKLAISFISSKLELSIAQATEVYKSYYPDVSLGLYRDYGIPILEYFENSWNVDAAKYLEADQRLRKELQDISVKKALLTAAPRIWANRALERLGVGDLFSGFYYGDGVIRKPDREAFAAVLRDFNVASPASVLMVDDDKKCIGAAKAIGMTTVLVGSSSTHTSDFVVNDIYELGKSIGAYLRRA